MATREVKFPAEPSEYGFGFALKLAREKLSAISDLNEQCRKAGAEYDEASHSVGLYYVNSPLSVSLPEGKVIPSAGQALTARDEILILHYFTQAGGMPPTGKNIDYKELPGGTTYFPVFYKRAIKPIVTHFGAEPEKLLEIGAGLGGVRSDSGDFAVKFRIFPNVPVTWVLWRADTEFPAEGNIVLDSSVTDYLSNEDVNVMCEIMAWKLVKMKLAK